METFSTILFVKEQRNTEHFGDRQSENDENFRPSSELSNESQNNQNSSSNKNYKNNLIPQVIEQSSASILNNLPPEKDDKQTGMQMLGQRRVTYKSINPYGGSKYVKMPSQHFFK